MTTEPKNGRASECRVQTFEAINTETTSVFLNHSYVGDQLGQINNINIMKNGPKPKAIILYVYKNQTALSLPGPGAEKL